MPYEPLLGLRQTERGIRTIKKYFQTKLAGALNLLRVSAPLFVLADAGSQSLMITVSPARATALPVWLAAPSCYGHTMP